MVIGVVWNVRLTDAAAAVVVGMDLVVVVGLRRGVRMEERQSLAAAGRIFFSFLSRF